MFSVKRLWVGIAAGLILVNGVLYASRHGGHGHFGLSVVIGAPLYEPYYICPPPYHYWRPPVVVAAPPVVVAPSRAVVVKQPESEETVVVWINNENGSKTPVTLTKQKDTGYYVGPRGEYYVVLPTDEQLRPLYGLPSKKVKAVNLTLWVVNDNGSKTPVTLTPSNGGFVGPSGEFYATLPTQEQLKAVYGLPSTKTQENTTVVWIENDGKKVPVVLVKEGDDFVGPSGEHYAVMPTKEQLENVYGKTASLKANPGTVTIWIENNGTKIPVTLQKQGTQYIGPNGEQYSSLPTADQLKPIYAPADGDEFGVQITKDDGTQTVITLKRKGTEYIGPNGESYATLPTEEQLKTTYGK